MATNLIAVRAMAALNEANGDRQQAVAILRQWSIEEGELYRELTMPLLEQALWDAIRGAVRTWRASEWQRRTIRPLPSEQSNRQTKAVEGLEAMGEAVAAGLLEKFQLPHSSVCLGNATSVDLEDAITFYRKQAAGNAAKARFLSLVLGAMEDAQCVRDALTEEQVRTLRDRAKGPRKIGDDAA